MLFRSQGRVHDVLVLLVHDPLVVVAEQFRSFPCASVLAEVATGLHFESEHATRLGVRNQDVAILRVAQSQIGVVAAQRQLRERGELSCESNRVRTWLRVDHGLTLLSRRIPTIADPRNRCHIQFAV